MVVLVVDDQTQVVHGLVSGVDWEGLGVHRVLKAYNAFEAREILGSQHVDILLCDIEMPVESGLELFRWTRERKLDVECIFLTAHADFDYAKTAMQLGGFDYIVQPAKYETIGKAILGAIQKVNQKNETQKFYSYGKLFQQNKEILLDRIVNDYLSGRTKEPGRFLEDLRRIQLPLDPGEDVYLVLLNAFHLKNAMESWGSGLLKFSIGNIVLELLGRYEQRALYAQLDETGFALLVYSPNRPLIDPEGLLRQLQKLIEVYRGYYGCDIACYASERISLPEVPGQAAKLMDLLQNNVSLVSKVFRLNDQIEPGPVPYSIPDMKLWGKLLEQGDSGVVRDQAFELLHRQAATGKLDAEFLMRFYQQFMQMAYAAAETMSIPLQRMFPDEERLQQSLSSYGSLDAMKDLIGYLMDGFEYAAHSEADKQSTIESIVQYIRDHIDEDIRRTDIAEAVYLNPNYVSRLFKSEMGVSLKDYIVTEKMKLAQALLKSTKLPIGIIAMKVGYSNFSHFSQVYKKKWSITPAEDRQQS